MKSVTNKRTHKYINVTVQSTSIRKSKALYSGDMNDCIKQQ